MRGILELVPLALGITLVAGLTWFLLTRDIALGTWLLAALLLFHGWVHVMFVFPAPEPAAASAGSLAYPFDMSRSWLISNVGLDAGVVRGVGVVLMIATVAWFLLAALATVGWIVPAGWWPGLVLFGATTSTLLLVVFFSPALLLGFGINAVLWWMVIAAAWTPVAAGSPVTS